MGATFSKSFCVLAIISVLFVQVAAATPESCEPDSSGFPSLLLDRMNTTGSGSMTVETAVNPDGYIYVTHPINATDQIFRYAIADSMTELVTFGAYGDQDGQFQQATRVAFFADRLYAGDWNTSRIQMLDADGQFLGIVGTNRGEFNSSPGNILYSHPVFAVNPLDSALYVYDNGPLVHRVQKFNMAGQFIEVVADFSSSGTCWTWELGAMAFWG